MRKKTIIILIGVFSVGIILGLFIPHLQKKEVNSQFTPTNFLSGYLSLSKSQKGKMESLDKSFYARVEKIRTQLDQKRAELSKLLGEFPSNREKIEVKVNEISSLQAQLQKEVINHLAEIRQVLTPTQQTKFFSFIRRRMCPRMEGWGK